MKIFTMILTASLLFITGIYAHSTTPESGTEFWVLFMKNYRSYESLNQLNNHELNIMITCDKESNVSIESSGLNINKKIRVKKDSLLNFSVPPGSEVTENEDITDKGIKITSDNPITVYCLNSRYQTSDIYKAFPAALLGNEYVGVSRKNSDGLLSQIAVLATEDGTKIEIFPSVLTLQGKAPEQVFVVYLNEGQTFLFQAMTIPGVPKEDVKQEDLTGTRIVSSKKIAVFGGHECAYVPARVIACNHLCEQLIPIEKLGSKYYVPKLEHRNNSSVRILAVEHETDIKINGKWIESLKERDYYDINDQKSDLFIETSKKSIVAQYSQGFRNGDSIGDPMMMLIRPVESFNKSFTVINPLFPNWNHYISITVPESAYSSLKVDGKMPDKSIFRLIEQSKMMIGSILVNPGVHKIECDSEISVNIYGFGTEIKLYDAYGGM